MADVDVASDLWDQPEAIEFGELIGDEDGWRFLIKLWAWGVERQFNPDDKEKAEEVYAGISRLSTRRLTQVCGYDGDPQVFFDALVKCRWLVDVEQDGKSVRHRMRGFKSKYHRLFSERLRSKRNHRKMREAKETRASTRTDTGTQTRGSTLLPCTLYRKETSLFPAEAEKAKPAKREKPKKDPTPKPSSQVVALYRELTGQDFDPRASYKLVNSMIAAGVPLERIKAVVEDAVKRPYRFPDGGHCDTLAGILSEKMFPKLEARLHESGPSEPQLSPQQKLEAFKLANAKRKAEREAAERAFDA